MFLTRMPPAVWTMQGRNLSVPLLVVIALLVAVIVTLLRWTMSIDAQVERAELQLGRLSSSANERQATVVEPHLQLGPAELKLLRNEVALLNKDWAGLLNEFVPPSAAQLDIKLLGVDVDPSTGTVTLDGEAASPSTANAYAAWLQHHSAQLREVRLRTTERDGDRSRFQVSAQWSE